jgi:transglutaminase-like putative cysteine protease
MFYSIRHVTKFRYSNPVSESLMEVRMHPRHEGQQRCLTFQLSVSPRVRVLTYKDYLGNVVHHFDVPGHHSRLLIVAETIIDLKMLPAVPERLAPSAWDELDVLVGRGDYWEFLVPSHFAKPTSHLQALAKDLGASRRDDPMSVLRELNAAIFRTFDYSPKSTKVDSPIDHALRARQGVCQDFAHIMIALVRELQIPCRYVSGYLYHRQQDQDRSSEGASHAWVEALLPGCGWVGFDPTNNLLVRERHIRTAIGRDYFDVPPTKGLFKGATESELSVSVRVAPSDELPPEDDEFVFSEDWSRFLEQEQQDTDAEQMQIQQQQ